MEQSPVISKNRGISPIWILPILALGLCSWIFYQSYQNSGVAITIYFEDATGITPGKTQVMAKGLPIGLVKEVHPDLVNQRIRTLVKMDKNSEQYLVEDTIFWVVRPEISGKRVQGLDTILGGSYIDIQVGGSQQPSREYIGLPSPPPISEEAPGLHLRLRADALNSIQEGSGIYYKKIQIGSVQRYSLEKDHNILINLHIKPEYDHLVRKGSRFANISGIEISGKLTNLKIQVESLASLLMGGVVLYTPDKFKNTAQAKNGDLFILYKDKEAAKFGLHMSLKLASGVGIVEGATKVRYRGLDAGLVEKITFNNDERHSVTAHILLDPRAEIILKEGTQFWMVEPQINAEGFKNLNTIISGPYITFKPGKGEFKDAFEILPSPPSLEPLRPGKEYVLTTRNQESLSKGAPVLFQKVKVGEVTGINIGENHDIMVRIYIYQQYNHLIQKNSVFWNSSGIKLDASLSGLRVETGSMAAILQGGISFVSPVATQDKSSTTITEETTFSLYSSYSEATKNVSELRPHGYHFQIRADNIGSISEGSPILFKKIKVGKVIGFKFSQSLQDILLECIIHHPYISLINSSSRFFELSGLRIEGNLSGLTLQTGSFKSILSGGIGFITPNKQEKQKKKTAFFLYSSKEEAERINKIPLRVTFKEIHDLKVGSPLKYRGIDLGKVSKINFSKDHKSIVVTLYIEKDAASFFRETTQIWLEKPIFKLTEIRNLDTIITGSYLTFSPGRGKEKRLFEALTSPPLLSTKQTTGLNLLLTARNLGSLQVGSPVYFRQIPIGRVISYKLSETFQEVHINVNIAEPYIKIIREQTRFWKVSGYKIEGGLFSGVSVTTQSLEAFIAGGIALATPEIDEMGEPVTENHHFMLHMNPKPEWLKWKAELPIEEEKNTQ